MTDKNFPVTQMQIVEYRGKVIKLKNPQKGIAGNHAGNRQEPEPPCVCCAGEFHNNQIMREQTVSVQKRKGMNRTRLLLLVLFGILTLAGIPIDSGAQGGGSSACSCSEQNKFDLDIHIDQGKTAMKEYDS